MIRECSESANLEEANQIMYLYTQMFNIAQASEFEEKCPRYHRVGFYEGRQV